MNYSSSAGVFVAVVSLLFTGACSSSSNTDSNSDPSTDPGTPGGPAASSQAACHGTVSGAANGAFTCENHALFFLPGYQSAALLGNTEFTFESSTMYDLGMSPPGIASIIFAGILPGALKPGTYTKEQLLDVENSAALLQFTDNRSAYNVESLKLVVDSVTPGEVYDDVVSKRGQTRDDQVTGSIELVMGSGANQVTISGVME